MLLNLLTVQISMLFVRSDGSAVESFVIHPPVFREISQTTSTVLGNGHPDDNSFQSLLSWISFESQIKGLALNLIYS